MCALLASLVHLLSPEICTTTHLRLCPPTPLIFTSCGSASMQHLLYCMQAYANSKAIKVVGDMPIYVGGQSADVWAYQDLFELSESGAPATVSGVPPDAFSDTGQLWGSPLYDWQVCFQAHVRVFLHCLQRHVVSAMQHAACPWCQPDSCGLSLDAW